MKIFFQIICLICLGSLSNDLIAAEKTTIRIGVLPFGTLQWEMKVLTETGRFDTNEYRIETRAIANPQAGKIALLANSLDMIVSDWVWVSRQRASGFDFTFYPYSNTAGALVVKQNSTITQVQDLKGKRLGIAGGELDKNWLLLRALAKQKNYDLDQGVKKVFAAPPLLNQQLIKGNVDAIITYWHYAARLESKGFKQLIDSKSTLQALGISTPVPLLGYVFNSHWAKQNKNAIEHFFAASRLAKQAICDSDSTWEQIVPLTKTTSDQVQGLLRKGYCEGRVEQWGIAQQEAAEEIYLILKQLSNNRLTGVSEFLQAGTFWFAD